MASSSLRTVFSQRASLLGAAIAKATVSRPTASVAGAIDKTFDSSLTLNRSIGRRFLTPGTNASDSLLLSSTVSVFDINDSNRQVLLMAPSSKSYHTTCGPLTYRDAIPSRYFSSSTTGGNDGDDVSSSPVENSNKYDEDYGLDEIMSSFKDTSYFDDDPLDKPDFSNMSNEDLDDTTTIPGWELIHSPPTKGKIPRGALVGTVVSTKMQKTVNVAVDRYKIARIYRKRLKYTRKFMAHDENEVAKDGDLVMIVPSHKISKHKHFMLHEIVRPKGQL